MWIHRILVRGSGSHRSLIGDFTTSLLTQGLVVSCNLATLKCAAHFMSVDDVGEFVLLRRVMVFLAPLLLLGLGVGLPRSLGRQNAGPGRQTYGAALLLSGWLLGAIAALVMALVFLFFPRVFANLLLGSADNAGLMRPLAWMVLGYQLFMLVYAIRRGRLEIQRANLMQALQVALLPLAVVLWRGSQGAQTTLQTLGLASVGLSAAASFLLLIRVDMRAAWNHARSALRELTSYGLPRVPGDLAAAGLYALGPILVAHRLDLQAAGMLAVGMSLITVLSAAFGPIGLVLLPRLSQHLAGGQEEGVRRRLPLLLSATFLLSMGIAVLGSLFGNTWMGWILNDSFSFPPLDLAFLMVAAGANVVFVMLRSVIDAAIFQPRNSLHTGISLAVLVLSWSIASSVGMGGAFREICFATGLGFVTLAGLTFQCVLRRFRLAPRHLLTGIISAFHALRRSSTVVGDSTPETTTPQEVDYESMGHERCTEAMREKVSRQREEEVERAH